MMRESFFVWMMLLLTVGPLTLLTGCSQQTEHRFQAVDLAGADYAKELALPDHNGQQRSLADFRGKIVVVFFGYTQCPDVCPTTLNELLTVKQKLGADGAKLQGLFVTVDPQRDTAPLLKAYMESFGPDFTALRPNSEEQLAGTASHFKVFYKKVEGKTAGSYSMDHSAGSYIFDTQGRLRLYAHYGSGADALVADIRLLLKER